MKKILSIITINLNNLTGLVRTIESLSGQIDDRIEVIVIDGDSTDGSQDFMLMESLNIQKQVSEKDAGIYDAMNKGIALAEGDFCLFLNSGDVLAQNGALLNALEHCNSDIDLLIGSLCLIGHSIWTIPDKIDLAYFLNSTLPHQSTIIKRDLLLKYPFDIHLKIVGDWDFFLRVFKCEKEVKYVKYNEIIAEFDMNGISSQSNNQNFISMEREMVLQREIGDGLKLYITETNRNNSRLSSYHVKHLYRLSQNNIFVKCLNVFTSLFSRLIK